MINELKHVLFLPDGNRRYAERKGLDYGDGYELCVAKWWELTQYTFKTERIPEVSVVMAFDYNFDRKGRDFDALLEIFRRTFVNLSGNPFLTDNSVAVEVNGELEKVYERKPALRNVTEDLNAFGTEVAGRKDNPNRLHFLLAYSPEKEMQRNLATLIAKGIDPNRITFEMLREHSFSPNLVNLAFMTGQFESEGQTNPYTYLARTMLHMENARMYSLDKLFPELTTEDIHEGIQGYRQLERTIKERTERLLEKGIT